MRHARSGFSLMEVMLATSIVLGSSIVLVELASIGRKQATSAYDLNIAQLLCQAKLDELIAGVSTIKVVEEQELEDDPGWFYSVEMAPMHQQKLVAIKVSVFQEEQESRKPIRFSLIRWMPEDVLNASDSILNEPSLTTTRPPSTQTRQGPAREDQP